MRALIALGAFFVGISTVGAFWAAHMEPPRRPAHDVSALTRQLRLNPDVFNAAAEAAQVDPTPPPQGATLERFEKRWRDAGGNAWMRLKGPIEAGLVRRERGKPLERTPDILVRIEQDWWYWENPPKAP